MDFLTRGGGRCTAHRGLQWPGEGDGQQPVGIAPGQHRAVLVGVGREAEVRGPSCGVHTAHIPRRVQEANVHIRWPHLPWHVAEPHGHIPCASKGSWGREGTMGLK